MRLIAEEGERLERNALIIAVHMRNPMERGTGTEVPNPTRISNIPAAKRWRRQR